MVSVESYNVLLQCFVLLPIPNYLKNYPFVCSAREQRFERVIHWAKDINIRKKKVLFVPIFDE